MSSAQICLRELHQAIPDPRCPTLSCDRKGDEKRAREVRVKRRVLHRRTLANVVGSAAVQPEWLSARLL